MIDTLKVQRDFALDPSLVLYLPLYELDGKKFMSRDAYGHLCTVTGALWTPRGRSFNSAGDYISGGAASSLDITSSGLTVISWIYPKSLGGFNFGRAWEKNVVWSCFFGAANTLSFLVRISSANKSTSTGAIITYNNWHCVGMTHDGSKVRGFVAGDQKGEGAAVGDIDSTADDFLLGNREDHARTWDGFEGEVWVYKRPFSQLEMQNICLATKWRYQ